MEATSFPTSFDVSTLNAVSNPRGFKMTDSATGGRFGSSVSGAGDVNRDGFADLIVGAIGENSYQGASYVVFGQAASFPANFNVSTLSAVSNPRGFKIIDSALHGDFGSSVSGAEDVNRDGFADLIVGAYGENSSNGASYVVFGGVIANGTSSSLNAASKPNNPYGFFSSSTLQATPEPLTEFNRSTRLRGGR